MSVPHTLCRTRCGRVWVTVGENRFNKQNWYATLVHETFMSRPEAQLRRINAEFESSPFIA